MSSHSFESQGPRILISFSWTVIQGQLRLCQTGFSDLPEARGSSFFLPRKKMEIQEILFLIK